MHSAILRNHLNPFSPEGEKLRILHGRVEIQNFSSSVEKYLQVLKNIPMKYWTISWKISKGAIFIWNHSNSDLFTCENNMLSSHVRYHVFACKLTWYFIGVYIIIVDFTLSNARRFYSSKGTTTSGMNAGLTVYSFTLGPAFPVSPIVPFGPIKP